MKIDRAVLSVRTSYMDECGVPSPNKVAMDLADATLEIIEYLELHPDHITWMGDEGGVALSWMPDNIYAAVCCYNDGEVILHYRIIGTDTLLFEEPTEKDYTNFKLWLERHAN